MDRETEKLEVTLLNGMKGEVMIYKRISIKEKYDIILKAAGNISVKSEKDINQVMGSIDFIKIIPILADKIWSPDNQYTVEDVDGTELNEILTQRISCFLGDLGVTGSD